MVVLRRSVGIAVTMLGLCVAGCRDPVSVDESDVRVEVEAEELKELKEEVSPEELAKASRFGDDTVPDRVVLRRLQQAKAKSKATEKKPER